MLKYIYIILKRIISACKTVHFSLRNGPFCVLKRTVLQCQMVCIGNSLVISAVQKWNGKRYNMNFFYILSTAFSPDFSAKNIYIFNYLIMKWL